MAAGRQFTEEELRLAVSQSSSVVDVLKHLGINYRSGSAWSMVKSGIALYGLDTSHFRRANSGTASFNKKHWSQILIHQESLSYRNNGQVTRALLEAGAPYKCVLCGLENEWQGNKLVLQLDHVNGDWRDNRKDNLRLLCPNCHSQTDTFSMGSTRIRRNVAASIDQVCTVCTSPYKTKSEPRRSATNVCSRRCAAKLVNHPEKIAWPDESTLAQLVRDNPVCRVAEILGVGTTAIRERCAKLGVPTRPRGYWQKIHAG